MRMKLVVRGRDAEGMMKVVRMVPVVSRYGMQMVLRRVVRMVVVTRKWVIMAVRQWGWGLAGRKVMVARRVVRIVVVTRNLMAVRQRGLVVERRNVMDRERMVVVLSPRSWRRVFGTTR